MPNLYKIFVHLCQKILTETLEKHINRYFQGSVRLSKQRLVGSIKKDFPDWSDNTINMYLSKLKKEGNISAPSRGIYKLDSNSPFQPKVSNQIKKISNKIKLEFPYITFCVWDNVWINDFMRHQPFKHYIVIEVEKDASESVFGFLSDAMKNVFLNPDEEIYELYIHNFEEAFVVKNLVSEAPLIEVQKVVIPSLEKLLVDMLIDIELFSAQQNEKEFIMKRAMAKFTLNELKMRRYADRRNREKEIDELISMGMPG